MNPCLRLIEADQREPKTIAVVGDAMTDIWYQGAPETCQDHCSCLRQPAEITTPGGALNAVRQLTNWRCHALGLTYPDIAIPVKMRFVDEKNRILFRADILQRMNSESTEQKFLFTARLDCFNRLCNANLDAVLISDYDKGFLNKEMIKMIIDYCNDRNIPCVADPKQNPHFFQGSILKVNEEYSQKFLEKNGGLKRYFCNVIVTQGSRNPFLWVDCRPYFYSFLPNYLQPVPCVNHIGAGDCFAAHLTLALAHGLNLAEAVSIAHAAGRVFVQHPFARPPYPHEITKDLDPIGGKQLHSSQLAALRESNPGRIVFTNGVFRLFTPGHAWLLQWARQRGDILVVGVNDDASAGRLRSGQLVLPLEERIALLASQNAVDWIVPFAEDNPCAMLQSLKADVLVKGNEYADTTVPGADMVGQVLFAPDSPFPNHATQLVEKCRISC